MLALQKAGGLPPHFAITRCFEMEAFAPSKSEACILSLSLLWQVEPRGQTPPPDLFKLTAAGRVQ